MKGTAPALVGAAALIVAALTGCTTAAPPESAPTVLPPSSSSSPVSSAAPEATATSTPTPSADPTVLLTVTATVTAPNGATARLSQVVHQPIATTPTMATDVAMLNAQCTGWQKLYPHRNLMTTEVTSTTPLGTASWKKYDGLVGVFFDGAPAWAQGITGAQATCAGGPIHTIPSSVHGVTPVSTTDPVTGPSGWAKVSYGFAIDTGTEASYRWTSTDVKLTDCSLTLSAYALAADPSLASWQAQTKQTKYLTCMFGGSD